jgi:hypothetical protein
MVRWSVNRSGASGDRYSPLQRHGSLSVSRVSPAASPRFTNQLLSIRVPA